MFKFITLSYIEYENINVWLDTQNNTHTPIIAKRIYINLSA